MKLLLLEFIHNANERTTSENGRTTGLTNGFIGGRKTYIFDNNFQK